MGTHTYTVDSGWKLTNSAMYTGGPNSWAWSAKVTFTVFGPEPGACIGAAAVVTYLHRGWHLLPFVAIQTAV